MALTSEQVALTAEMVRESSDDVVAAIAAKPLGAAEESLLVGDITIWSAIRNSFIKYKGEGVDFDNERKREAIFYRVRRLLGFPFVLYDLNTELMELVELEAGQNFG